MTLSFPSRMLGDLLRLVVVATIVSNGFALAQQPRPFVSVSSKILPPSGCGSFGGGFGEVVAMSGDGTTAAVGCPYSADPLNEQNFGYGATVVYERSPVTDKWNETGIVLRLNMPGEIVRGEGSIVALSFNGNILASGAPQLNNSNGAIVIYERVLGVWGEQAIIDASDVGNQFGQSVDVSADGTMVVAASFDLLSIFILTAPATWTLLQSLAPLTVNQYFLPSITISRSQTLISVCESASNLLGIEWSSVNQEWVYAHALPNIFSEQQALSKENEVWFATNGQMLVQYKLNQTLDYEIENTFSLPEAVEAVTANANGSIVAIGMDDIDLVNIYWRDVSVTPAFKLIQSLRPFDVVQSQQWQKFGSSMEMSDDGARMIISGEHDQEIGGAIYFFERTNSSELCRPQRGMSKSTCNIRMGQCAGLMKWTGVGCRVNGKVMGDGGCQCVGYCAYKCKGACNADSECKWKNNKCFSKGLNLPGKPITQC